MDKNLKVALVHDDLVQWGGAERVLEALTEVFPGAPIYTSVYDNKNFLLEEKFHSKKIITSFIQKIPSWRTLYKILLPLYPVAFEQFDFSRFDLVISHSTRFAKSVITKPKTRHVCYCPTPPRFLWHLSGEKISPFLQPTLSFLRIYDQISANRVDQWIANSENVKNRIRKIYKAEAKVVYPFVDLETSVNKKPFEGGYFLVISRLNSYKRVDLAVKAANFLRTPLRIVGDGPQRSGLQKLAGPTIEFIGMVEEEVLVALLAGCKALVVAGEEDFGMVSLEAQALGKPVIAFGKGGSLETVVDGITGYLFPEQTAESLIEALVKLDKYGYNKDRCCQTAARFSKQEFIKQFRQAVFKDVI